MSLIERLLTFGATDSQPLAEAAPVTSTPRRMVDFASRVLQGAPANPEERGPGPNEKDRTWQSKAWEYRRQVGEVHYCADFVGSCFSRLALTLGVRTRTGAVVPAFDDEGNPLDGGSGVIDDALEILAALQGPIGGQRMLQRQCGEGLFVAGEMFLVGQDVPSAGMPGAAGGGSWELLSTSEIKVTGDKRNPRYERRAPGSMKGEEVPAEALVARIWKPDAEFPEQADSSIRGILDVAGELIWLDRLIKGTTRSRLAGSGVYWVANEIDYQPAANVQYPEGVDPFTYDLIRAFSAPLEDPDSASSAVPFVVRAAASYIKEGGSKHDTFGKGLADFPAIELRREAVQRLARGVSLPLEIVTGMGGASHWTAWQVDASLFRAHIAPLAEIMTDSFTGGFLWPMMEAAQLERQVRITLPNGTEVEGDLVVTYDPTELISYPNRSADADAAWDRLEISGTEYRKSKGFPEAAKPDDEEVEERLRRAQIMKRGTADVPDQVEQSPPEGTDQASVRGHHLGALAMRVADAADPFVKRVVERVGARLVSACEGAKQQNGAQLRDAIAGVPNRDVAATLGPKRVTELVNLDRLLASEFGPLVGTARRFAEESGDASVDPVALATAVGDRCVELAKTRLFQPARPVLASDFLDVVAPEMVER